MEVLGFGQVLWDLTAYVNFKFLKEIAMEVGGHRIVNKMMLDKILARLHSQKIEIVKNCGGSAANVMSNLAKLGTKTAFFGKHGDDKDGRKFMELLRTEGVETYSTIDKKNSTGQLISLLTPDNDRTFIVYWGASEVLPPEKINEKIILNAECSHVEGYLVIGSKDALIKIFDIAPKITFDLAAQSIIEKTKLFLQKLMTKNPPVVLFANLSEGQAFTKRKKPEDIVDNMLRYSENAVLTLGENGVLIKTQEKESYYQAAIKTIPVVDTTGAGDAFSAGFLHEFLKNGDIRKAAQLGVRVASVTIRKLGARSFQPSQFKEFGI